MMLEFRKSFANSDDTYPKDSPSMMDVMRQQLEPKKSRQPTPTSKDPDKKPGKVLQKSTIFEKIT